MVTAPLALPSRWRLRWEQPLGRAAVAAGTAVHWGWSRRRPFARMAPGLAGAALASLGTGETVSHVFGHGLAPWVACCVAAGFLLRLSAEINRPAPNPPEPEG